MLGSCAFSLGFPLGKSLGWNGGIPRKTHISIFWSDLWKFGKIWNNLEEYSKSIHNLFGKYIIIWQVSDFVIFKKIFANLIGIGILRLMRNLGNLEWQFMIISLGKVWEAFVIGKAQEIVFGNMVKLRIMYF